MFSIRRAALAGLTFRKTVLHGLRPAAAVSVEQSWNTKTRFFSEQPIQQVEDPAKKAEEDLLNEIKSNTYSPKIGLQMLRQVAKTRGFDETLEISVKLNLDVRQGDQIIRSNVTLPNDHGKSRVRVIVFADEEAAAIAKNAGATVYGLDNIIQRIKSKKLRLTKDDKVLATPDVLKKVQKEIAKILGTKGLMPNAKLGTVVHVDELEEAIDLFKNRSVLLRTSKFPQCLAGIGKMSMSDEALLENIRAFLLAVMDKKPSGAKGKYLQQVHIASSMSPGVELDLHYCNPVTQYFMREN